MINARPFFGVIALNLEVLVFGVYVCPRTELLQRGPRCRRGKRDRMPVGSQGVSGYREGRLTTISLEG